MSLSEDLTTEVQGILRERWQERDGNVVPESEDLTLSNSAVKLDAVVLYSDLADSTALVDSQTPQFAAEIYKCFLHCAAKIVKDEGGAITAYDGDRIMAVFIGELKNTPAVRAALKINWARIKIINPAIKAQYPKSTYEVKHVTAVDRSQILVARTGVRGANDLVWVGRAANHAAKMANLPATHATRISAAVYKGMQDEVKVSNGTPIWEEVTWTEMKVPIYRSNWMRKP